MTRHLGFILLSVFVSLVVALMPLPIAFEMYRPDLVLLVIMYWSIALPHRVNIGFAWMAGLIIDLALGSPLGVRSLTYSIVIYITASNYQKIRNFSVWQQAMLVALFLALYYLLVFWLNHFLLDIYFLPQYLWPVLTGALAWPWLFLLLRKYRRHFRIR
ncbi:MULTISPECIES: rod shape-determining protein MreD [unclassified Pseudoalteromonas]|uniref:rod shape-determining protein MreD n=1 Tax=unclassified Pseudoalteromonas TaxID=194690 RepID=UPI0006D60536|nr:MULTISPECIES: rod shape-determining protein MreD [unclassified Pseudoalteromonas]KPV96813.1 Rod shape-determining protein MreD [Pseudoalteromonas sp. P1-9]MCF6458448.1 rod shape-determining protein MreD [Pseudoalteromonas sp. MMG024]